MNETKDGGPAFPLVAQNWHREGMTLRDFFAAKAMQGMLAEDGGGALNNEELAEFAYVIADAMLKARER